MAGKKDGKYFDHVLGWLKYRTNSSVHFVFYEDLKKVTLIEQTVNNLATLRLKLLEKFNINMCVK